jgi:hypothetical protein
MKKIIFFTTIASLIGFLSSCHKHDEGEVITTVKIVLTPQGGGTAQTFIWRDADGPGGNAPDRTDTIRISDSTVYNAETFFLNESGGKNEDITTEIKNEAKEHIVCYSVLVSNVLSVAYADNDGKHPIGLKTTWTTGQTGNDLLRVNLRHQPKSKDGTCEPGESDVDVNLNIEVTRK